MSAKIIMNGILHIEDDPVPGQYIPDTRISPQVHPDSLTAYLTGQKNAPENISRLRTILQMDGIILEIGCGGGGIAKKIAQKNPDIGVIATDQYDWAIPARYASNYQKTALAWKEKQLETQSNSPDNLVLLRAEVDILLHFAENSINTILLINSEPKVGQVFLESLKNQALYGKIKPGKKQIVILPFSKEMGVACCGGYEFDHSEDWSPGLGFMMASGFEFHKGAPVQWGVDLVKSSPYSGNSTQKTVYILKYRPNAKGPVKKSDTVISRLRKFARSAKQAVTFQI